MGFKNYLKPNNKYEKVSNPFSIQQNGFKTDKNNSLYRTEWSEDVFISDNHGKEVLGKSFDFRKLPIIIFFLFFFLSLLLGKVAWLQVVKGDYYYKMAEGNRVRVHRIEPKRGIVYDKNKTPLVRNAANFKLYFVPIDLPSKREKEKPGEMCLEDIISGISGILKEVSEKDLYDKLATIKIGSLESYSPLFVVDNIEYEKAMSLYLKSALWPGVVLSNSSRREYPNMTKVMDGDKEFTVGLSLSHILGYTGKINDTELQKYGKEYQPIDYIGKMGLEYFWENELKGVNGKKQIEVDALGKEKKIIGQVDASDGHGLVLALDLPMQTKLEGLFLKYMGERKLTKGSAVVMNPNNGEVLAMVSLPAFDNNLFAHGISQEDYSGYLNAEDRPLFNRAVGGEFPPGSTFKMVLAAGALQERIISESTKFLSNGGLRISQWFFPDWKGGGHGMTDVKKAIAESVNTFFYFIGGGYNDFVGLGVDKIVEYAEEFGFGKQTGIDLNGEASGFVPTKEWKSEVKKEKWYIGDTYHLSIGQGDMLVTPLQVAAYTSVFANGSSLYRPHLVKQIISHENEVVSEIQPEVVRKDFIDPININVVREGMRQTVTNGSARRLNTLKKTSAGKTGTAQWSSKKDPHAWFTGFAPYEKPEIAFVFLVEEGKEGSVITISIAHDFLEWYFEKY